MDPWCFVGRKGHQASPPALQTPFNPIPGVRMVTRENPADKPLPTHRDWQASRRLQLSLLGEQPETFRVEEAGNSLSASSVPHNWLSFANLLLGWECTKSPKGASSHYERLPKIRDPSPL